MSELKIDSILEDLEKNFEEDLRETLWEGFSSSIQRGMERELEKKLEEIRVKTNRQKPLDMKDPEDLRIWLELQKDEKDDYSTPMDDIIEQMENELNVDKNIGKIELEEENKPKYTDEEFEGEFNSRLKSLIDTLKNAYQDLSTNEINNSVGEKEADE